MTPKITILVGTMTGTAQLCAQEMELVLDDGETEVQTRLMDGLDASAFGDRERVYLVCTSTYGQGDVPDNAKSLYEALQRERPDLSGIRYGVYGLGDRTYAETFNAGGRRFDDVLQSLGAERIGERHQHDASSGVLAEEAALEWVKDWIELVRERLGTTAEAPASLTAAS